jgi:hypothetical protein
MEENRGFNDPPNIVGEECESFSSIETELDYQQWRIEQIRKKQQGQNPSYNSSKGNFSPSYNPSCRS